MFEVRTAAAFHYQCSMLALLAHHDQCCGWKIHALAYRPLSGDCHESLLAISLLLRWYEWGTKSTAFQLKDRPKTDQEEVERTRKASVRPSLSLLMQYAAPCSPAELVSDESIEK